MARLTCYVMLFYRQSPISFCQMSLENSLKPFCFQGRDILFCHLRMRDVLPLTSILTREKHGKAHLYMWAFIMTSNTCDECNYMVSPS